MHDDAARLGPEGAGELGEGTIAGPEEGFCTWTLYRYWLSDSWSSRSICGAMTDQGRGEGPPTIRQEHCGFCGRQVQQAEFARLWFS